MTRSTKGRTISEYYRIVDEQDYGSLSDVFDPDVEFVRPGEDAVTGRENLADYLRNERKSRDTTHEILECTATSRNSTLAKVSVSGELPSGTYQGDIIGEFDFDTETGLITRYKVYRGYDR